jgi:hypothetical protein
MNHRRLLCLLFLAIGSLAGSARAQNAPAAFAIVADQQPASVALKSELTFRYEGTTLPAKADSAVLRLDGTPLGVAPRTDRGSQLVTFLLDRTEDKSNHELWSRLLGSPFAQRIRPVAISLEIDGKPMLLRFGPKPSDVSTSATIDLTVYDTSYMALGLFLAAVVVIVTWLMCFYTSIIRDPTVPQMLRRERPYSLGRTQMAFWFCIIFASFVFIGAITFDSNSINAQSFILLGISSATALGAIAVDQTKDSKDSKTSSIQANIADLGLNNGKDVAKLADAVSKSPNDFASTVVAKAKLASNPTPRISALWQAYQEEIADLKSDGFLRDLVNDINGPTIHRWQIVIWTILLGGIYVGSVYADLQTPTFDTNLLALMGISGLTYIGFKIPEAQSTQTKPAT